MNYYTNLHTLPIANYYEALEKQSPVYLYKFNENDPASELNFFDPPKEFPQEFFEIWEQLKFTQKEITLTELFKIELRILIYKSKAATCTTDMQSVYLSKINNESAILNEMTQNEKEYKFDLDNVIMNIEATLNYSINIDKFKYPTVKFLLLQEKAIKQNEYYERINQKRRVS